MAPQKKIVIVAHMSLNFAFFANFKFCFGMITAFFVKIRPGGGMVDTRDLKSLGLLAVPVQVRFWAPFKLFLIFQSLSQNFTKAR